MYQYVCSQCVNDSSIAEFIEANDNGEPCSYCENKSESATIEIGELGEYLKRCLERIYCPLSDSTAPYDHEIRRQIVKDYEINDLLYNWGFEPVDHMIFEDVVGTFDAEIWVEEDWQTLAPNDRLLYGWREFCRSIKHQRRYTFLQVTEVEESWGHPDETSIGTLLKEIKGAIESAGLTKTLTTKSSVYRVRMHGYDEEVSDDTTLGASPWKYAKANRMSPQGISMFYGAEDYDTAIKEVVDKDRIRTHQVTGGRFVPVRELKLLDLFDHTGMPSFFSDQDGHVEMIYAYIFLREFAEAISKELDPKNDIPEIEYVPTQAFCEYVRFNLQYDGIRYKSSKGKKPEDRKPCIVLFSGNIDEDKNQMVALDSSSLKIFEPEEIEKLFEKSPLRRFRKKA